MLKLTDKQMAEYYRRSYTTVDGLWFMKVEEKYGFDVALDVDDAVWEVLPKIQARMLKSMGCVEGGLEALRACLAARLTLDGFVFEIEQADDNNELHMTITECPWHNVMINAGREHLSEKVGTRICSTEYRVWASEFGENIEFELRGQICSGASHCRLLFRGLPE